MTMSTLPPRIPTNREGFMQKKTGIFRLWKNRFFVLTDDVVSYFKREQHKNTLTPTGRIFFSDISSVEKIQKKGRPYCMLVSTEKRRHLMSCSSSNELDAWVTAIRQGKESFIRKEKHDPVRRRSSFLGKDFKRITIKKDPTHGIGCTIKTVGGAIFVSRIIPEGPVAATGVLRPGDQIIDINCIKVASCQIEEIKDIISKSPELVVCTVKPVTHYVDHDDSPTPAAKSAYTEVDPSCFAAMLDDNSSERSLNQPDYANVDYDEMREKLGRSASREGSEYSRGSRKQSNDQLNYADIDFINQQQDKPVKGYAELDFTANQQMLANYQSS